MLKALREFLRLEAASGILLMLVSVLALAVANPPLNWLYNSLITLPTEVRVGDFQSVDAFFHPIPLGIMLGLFLGKQIGIFGLCWLAVRVRLARPPDDPAWSRSVE